MTETYGPESGPQPCGSGAGGTLFFGSGVEVFVVNDAMAEAACSSPSS